MLDSLYLRAKAFMTLFCMVSTLLRADMSPESRLVGEGETTVTESAPREVPGESYQGGGREYLYVGGTI